MEFILEENSVSFKALEQEIFRAVCALGQQIAKQILEEYDDQLARERDRSQYRDKGKRMTTIKTVFGEVEYSRRVYQTTTETGERAFVYLLDEAMGMNTIGTISTNLAEQMVLSAAAMPFRKAAKSISSTCGQTISATGIWNVLQAVGRKADEDEQCDVERMRAGKDLGERIIRILFEEMDSIFLKMQDKFHKKMKPVELKMAVMYEGWDERKEGENRSTLVGKNVLAGLESSTDFQVKREARIHRNYNADEIILRVLNGDGGSWINEPFDPDAIFQLDPFHVSQAILRSIKDRKVQSEIRNCYYTGKLEEMFDKILTYAAQMKDSPETENEYKKAMELYSYLKNNRDGLLPYDKRGVDIPEPPEGVVYKHMGVQEGQNCTVITSRMKHPKTRWSVGGANNMAKVLALIANKSLGETLERMSDGNIPNLKALELEGPLSASKAPKKDGKGNPYVDVFGVHMPLLDAPQTFSRRAFRQAYTY